MAAPSCADLLLDLDFEDGKQLQRCSGNCPAVVEVPFAIGRYALKSYLHKFDSKISYRTELVPVLGSEVLIDETRWYASSIYLPSNYVADNVWELVMQWWAIPDYNYDEGARNPVLSLHLSEGKWLLKNIWDKKENTFESGKRVYSGRQNWELGEAELDVWVDWVFHVKWSYKKDGILQVWKNGELVIDYKGPNTFNDKTGPIMKLGIYKGWRDRDCCKSGPVERTIYHDSIKIGDENSNFDEMSPKK